MRKINLQTGFAVMACAMLPTVSMADTGSEPASGTLGRLSARHYVQDGLVLHFDGIENAGLGKAHDSSATVWKDLSCNANDANIVRSTINEGDLGDWLENGYRFAGYSAAVTKFAQDIAPHLKATIQTVTMFNPADQRASYIEGTTRYNFYPSVFGANKNVTYIHTESTGSKLYFHFSNVKHGELSSWGGRYATILEDTGAGLLFQTDVPDKALVPGTSATSPGEQKWCIGSARVDSNQYGYYCAMTGTVHSVRAYSRVLTNDELKWNRVIDDYRFFGVMDDCLPTNAVVVVSETVGCVGMDPDGVYMPSGWTFVGCPDTKEIGGKDYKVYGYVLETWDAGSKTWTNPVTNLQSTAWTSPVSGNWSSVRLTWLAKVVRGVVAVPDVGDYVQNGLLLHLDGFRNAGAEKPHDVTATSWKDLAGDGVAAIVRHADGDSSAWTQDGYFFGGKTVAEMGNSVELSTTVTVQVACNSIDTSVQTAKYPTVMGLLQTRDSLNIYWNSDANYWYLKVGDYIAGEKRSWEGDYLTAICTGEKKSFFDTATPSSWGDWDKTIGTITPVFGGGRGHFQEAYTDWYLVGEIKNVRIYDRVLSDAELEKNREIDEVRRTYRPNVEVADGSCGAAVEEPGLYHVQGEWTFSATNVVDRFGCHRTVVGYTLEAAQDGAWGEPVRYHGSAYTHKVDEQVSDFVRLVWRLSPRGLRVIVR